MPSASKKSRRTPASALNPTALPLAVAAKVLSRLGSAPVTEEMLQTHVDCGAPCNADGTLHLVHYAAWLVREIAHGD